jgi:hypothetical protein
MWPSVGEENDMRRAVVVIAFGIVLASAAPGFAAAPDRGQARVAADASMYPMLARSVDRPLPSIHPRPIIAQPAPPQPAPSRGALLSSLYVGLAGLNAFDAYSTARALRTGAGTESNPVMRGVAGHSAAVWAVKGGVTGASVFLAERMWRNHHRLGAITTMVVVNGMTAVVAANNAKVLASR